MRLLAVTLAGLVLAAPAGAALRPGDNATVDVTVATLWKAPNLARAIDRPSLGNPVDLDAWNRNLATTASRVWLDAHVQTQALYAQAVTVLARSGGWVKVAVNDEPDPQDPHGYPGWLPASQLRTALPAGGPSVVVLARNATLTLAGGRTLALSYGTTLGVTGRRGTAVLVRTPDGAGSVPAADVGAPLHASAASIVAQ
ncbi:MAG TPA: hypothetical protein VGN27_04270, partial [Gaiellaceae bacterium]|nr:hypothetical protein [Gaiellaceae bacterium]